MIKEILFGILLLTPSAFTQFSIDAVHPDVTFGDSNDRFDLTAMIHDTNRMFHENQVAPDDDDFRRRNLNSNEEDLHIIEDLREDRLENERGSLSARRFDDSFVYHDRMDSKEGGNVMDFEENLKHFMSKDNLKKHRRRIGDYVDYLHGKDASARRHESAPNEQEVLMHYAMPIVMKIDGYMKVPLQ